jgi:predicted RNA binding protein YcfA (HicA-like mRNA interferase family)
MKRRDLIRHLEAHGCVLLREGGSHSVYVNRLTGKVSVVISKFPIHKTPNHALQPTAASGLRALAVPSSLRSSAAAEGER